MDPFEKIAADCIRAAEKVRCPIEKFVEGLETILEEVQARLDCAASELKNREEE